MVRYVQLY